MCPADYWYDSYPSGAPAFAAESGYVTTYDSRVRGLKTAERFCLLPTNVAPSAMTSGNTSTKEFRAFYYDAKGRVVPSHRSPEKVRSARSEWRPVGVFGPNGSFSGGGRHTECTSGRFAGDLFSTTPGPVDERSQKTALLEVNRELRIFTRTN